MSNEFNTSTLFNFIAAKCGSALWTVSESQIEAFDTAVMEGQLIIVAVGLTWLTLWELFDEAQFDSWVCRALRPLIISW